MTIREMIERLKRETGIENIEDYEFDIEVDREYATTYTTYWFVRDSFTHIEELNMYEVDKLNKHIRFFD